MPGKITGSYVGYHPVFSLRCLTCGRAVRDHTVGEIEMDACTFEEAMELAADRGGPTATDIGLVNPEAIEDTDEEFDLKLWARGVSDRTMRFVDAAADCEVELFRYHCVGGVVDWEDDEV